MLVGQDSACAVSVYHGFGQGTDFQELRASARENVVIHTDLHVVIVSLTANPLPSISGKTESPSYSEVLPLDFPLWRFRWMETPQG
jgi:hypothetical protein